MVRLVSCKIVRRWQSRQQTNAFCVSNHKFVTCFCVFCLFGWLILHRIWLISRVNEHWCIRRSVVVFHSVFFFVFVRFSCLLCCERIFNGNLSGGNSIDSMHALSHNNFIYSARECSIFVLHIFHSNALVFLAVCKPLCATSHKH